MSLRSQVAGLLVGLSIALAATMYAVQVLVVMPTYVDLERTGADRNVNRCLDALKRDLQSLSNTTNDWASWDDTYQYIQDHNSKFEVANLVDESFSNAVLNLICFVDRERKIVWGEVRDIESLAKVDVPDLFAEIQQESSPLTRHASVDDTTTGILLTSKGPMLLASRPVITTKRMGPIQGSLLMGRFLNQGEIDDLAERTHVKLDFWTVGQKDMPVEARRIVEDDRKSHETRVEAVDAETLHAYRVVNDIYNKPALVLRLTVPREVTAQGKVSTQVATACSLVGGGLTLAVMWIVLQRRILNPLQRMAAHAVRVGQSGDLKTRLNLARTDEIGTLAGEFDRMVENLAEYRKKVLDSAHRSGMAEVASEVLHNVGNAVNSAGCSVELLRERLDGSKVAGFDRAAALLREQAPHAAEFFGTDPRGTKLINYLVGLNEILQQEHGDCQSETDRLHATVCHIREVIAAQQSYAGQSEYRQETDLSTVVDEALALNREQLAANQIEVDVDLPQLPDLYLNKSKMTQVLVNLVRNAIQAMHDQASGVRRLTISARTVDESGIEIEVRDTGRGFDDEVRTKLFTHGFTTKPEGNGLGLHYCANAVKGAGGQITAESAGPGQGATFRIRLVHVMPLAAATT
jgi:sensor domain CHASE-containing protein/anti-sigma regulatory factor (Ser/Thr protein kinase)